MMLGPIRRVAFAGSAALALAAWPAQSAHAQDYRFNAGPRVGYNVDGENPLLGAHAIVPISRRFELYPSFDYYFNTPGTLLGFNGDLKWIVPADPYTFIYLGVGVNLLARSDSLGSSTDFGGNVIAGFEGMIGRAHPFIEWRTLLQDTTSFQIVGGVTIRWY